ncbi:hypothetical protein CHS0354_023417 [Potamilus streckersoni]|uniref:Uncharacterized protein n=1 Tax=Potamilus streckersoni TaxID=2493646 RepID=A0AAE0VFB3_9BIVA|nr:hypothetical protein CHS0354_023417 [Potamilus streckersoni]
MWQRSRAEPVHSDVERTDCPPSLHTQLLKHGPPMSFQTGWGVSWGHFGPGSCTAWNFLQPLYHRRNDGHHDFSNFKTPSGKFYSCNTACDTRQGISTVNVKRMP